MATAKDLSIRRLATAICLLCVIALIAAVVAERAFEYRPCEWCVVQRFAFLLICLTLLPSAFIRTRPIFAMLASFLAGGSVLLGIYSVWMQAAFSHLDECAFSLAGRIISKFNLEEIFPLLFRVSASCDAASETRFFGFPFYLWSGLAFAMVSILLFRIMRSATSAQRAIVEI